MGERTLISILAFAICLPSLAQFCAELVNIRSGRGEHHVLVNLRFT
jgi:hypothetical protein